MPKFSIKYQVSSIKYKKNILNTKYIIRNTGFTLIELLVAIVIISLVFGVVVSSAASIQRSARDTERRSELRNIQAALQQYYADKGFYPTRLTETMSGGGLTSCIDDTTTPNCPTSTNKKTYLKTIPTDPSARPYLYTAYPNSTLTTACDNSATGTKCFYYALCASLEGSLQPDDKVCTFNTNYNFMLNPI